MANSNDRDLTTGRFLSGNSGGPGRKIGSRNRLGEAFLADLHATWATHGARALERCAVEEPAQFARIVSTLLPDQVEIGSVGEFSRCENIGDVLDVLAGEFADASELLAALDELRDQIVARVTGETAAVAPPGNGKESGSRLAGSRHSTDARSDGASAKPMVNTR